MKISVKPNNFVDVLQSNEKQLSGIRKESGKQVASALVILALNTLQEVLDIELNKTQVDVITNNILTDFWHFKMADFSLIIKRLSYVKQYGKAGIGDIMSEIAAYNIQRMDVAESIGNKEPTAGEAERQRIRENIIRTYGTLKEKAKIPIISQKQKDADAVKANNEKFEQMKQEGLI